MMKLDPDPQVVKQISLLRQQGKTYAEILHFLAGQNLSDVEMMTQLMAAFQLSLGDVKCIDGWFPDGTGEIDDEAVNRILSDRISEREKEQAA